MSILDGIPNAPYTEVETDGFDADERHVRIAMEDFHKRLYSPVPEFIKRWLWPAHFNATITVNGHSVLATCQLVSMSYSHISQDGEYRLAIGARRLSHLAPEFYAVHDKCYVAGVAIRSEGTVDTGKIHLPAKFIVTSGYLNTLTVFGALCR